MKLFKLAAIATILFSGSAFTESSDVTGQVKQYEIGLINHLHSPDDRECFFVSLNNSVRDWYAVELKEERTQLVTELLMSAYETNQNALIYYKEGETACGFQAIDSVRIDKSY